MRFLLVVVLTLCLASCSGSGSGTAPVTVSGAPTVVAAASPAAAGPVNDPQRAAIIFLNGGAGAAELFAGPAGSPPTNLWPGVADTDLIRWKLHFPALAQVNVVENGRIVGRTTSSENYPDGCGSRPFQNGTVAEFEPFALQPCWFLPEKRGDELGPFADKLLNVAQTNYNNFGYQLQQQALATGRGQQVVFYAWDWRKFPSDQVAAFHQRVLQITQQTGVKVTVVAHSEGNLFFRTWIQYVESQGHQAGEYCGRFLSIAAPWLGVATSWEHLAFGTIQPGIESGVLSAAIGREKIREVFCSGGGTYVLLPTRANDDYISQTLGKTGESWLAIPDAAGGSAWVPFAHMPEAIQLQCNACPQSSTFPCLSQQLYDQAVAQTPPVGFHTSGIRDWVGIVGSGLQTPLQICSGALRWPDGSQDGDAFPTGGELAVLLEHRIRYTSGDKNVPIFSAMQGTDPFNPPGDNVLFYFAYNISHLDLMIDQDVLDETIPYLTGDKPLTYGGVFHTTPLP